jgi:hypothetical protein
LARVCGAGVNLAASFLVASRLGANSRFGGGSGFGGGDSRRGGVLAAGGAGAGVLTVRAGAGSAATGSVTRTCCSFAGRGRNVQSPYPSRETTTTAAAIIIRIRDVFDACSSARL